MFRCVIVFRRVLHVLYRVGAKKKQKQSPAICYLRYKHKFVLKKSCQKLLMHFVAAFSVQKCSTFQQFFCAKIVCDRSIKYITNV